MDAGVEMKQENNNNISIIIAAEAHEFPGTCLTKN